jgi:hypothetical protein
MVAAEVAGPLPRCPAERGEFVMEVSAYGSPPGWWILVEARASDRRAAPAIPLTQRGAHVHRDMTVQ